MSNSQIDLFFPFLRLLLVNLLCIISEAISLKLQKIAFARGIDGFVLLLRTINTNSYWEQWTVVNYGSYYDWVSNSS